MWSELWHRGEHDLVTNASPPLPPGYDSTIDEGCICASPASEHLQAAQPQGFFWQGTITANTGQGIENRAKGTGK